MTYVVISSIFFVWTWYFLLKTKKLLDDIELTYMKAQDIHYKILKQLVEDFKMDQKKLPDVRGKKRILSEDHRKKIGDAQRLKNKKTTEMARKAAALQRKNEERQQEIS